MLARVFAEMMDVGRVLYHLPNVDPTRDGPGDDGETALAWGGRGAHTFELDGPVGAADYWAMFGPGGARDPADDRPLVTTERPGIELICTQPKSISILLALGREADAEQILRADLDAQLDWLDRRMQRYGGRHGEHAERGPTGGLTYAYTVHPTSREGDPHLHAHVLIANVTLTDFGWRAVDSRFLHHQLATAAAVGRQAGARKADQLHYRIEEIPGREYAPPTWRLADIPTAVETLFSTRTQQIDRYLADRSARGLPSHRRVARTATAPDKTRLDIVDARAEWADRMEREGWAADQIIARLDRGWDTPDWDTPDREPDRQPGRPGWNVDVLRALSLAEDAMAAPLVTGAATAIGLAVAVRRRDRDRWEEDLPPPRTLR